MNSGSGRPISIPNAGAGAIGEADLERFSQVGDVATRLETLTARLNASLRRFSRATTGDPS